MTLDRGQVLQAATELLQQRGVEKLSMRTLAAQLNVSAMAVYNHVSGRQDLLDAIVEDRWSGLPLSPDLAASAAAYHRSLRQDPWLVPLYRSSRSQRVASDMSERLALDADRSLVWMALAALAAGLVEHESAGHAPGTDWESAFATFAARITGGGTTDEA